MRLTQGRMGNFSKGYQVVLKKCHFLTAFGALAAVLLLSAGTAQAVPATQTLTTSTEWNKAIQDYLDATQGGTIEKPDALYTVTFNGSKDILHLSSNFDTNELTLNNATLNITGKGRLDTDKTTIQNASTVNVGAVYVAGDGTSYVQRAIPGLVVDSNLVVGTAGSATGAISGTINTAYLDVQTYDAVGGAAATLTIEAGGRVNVSGNVNIENFSGRAGAEIVIKNNGHLRVGGTLTLAGGKISVNGTNGSIYFENDATLGVSKISSNTAQQNGIVLTDSGQVYGKKRLTLTGGTVLDAAGGNVKAAYMTINNSTGSLEVKDGGLKIYGRESATDTTTDVINAGTLFTSGAGRIQLGDGVTPTNAGTGNYGGTTKAKFTTAGTGGLSVEGGTWTVGDVTIGAGTRLSINGGTLDVSASTLETDARSIVTTGAKGTLKINNADVTLSGAFLDTAKSNIKSQIENDGFLEISDTATAITDKATYQAYISALIKSGSTGTISLKGRDMSDIASSTSLDQINTDFKGLDLTGTKIKAGSSTDNLSSATYVGSVDASTVSGGTYKVTGSLLVLAGNTDATQALIKTKASTDTIAVDNLQLGMTQKDASAGTLGNVTITTTLTAVNGDYTITTLESKKTDIKDGGRVKVGTMTATGAVIVGTSDSAHSGGTLTAGQLTLNGNLLFADPAWISDNTGHRGDYGSKVAVAEFTGVKGNTLDGDYYAGQASQISLGTTDTSILSGLLDKSKVWGTDITAAMYINAPVIVGTGSAIHVNGAQKTAPSVAANQANFADKSLLAVNAKAIGNTAAISAAGNAAATADIKAGAKLHLTNAQNGKEYTILSDFADKKITYATGGWSGVGNLLQEVTVTNAGTIGTDGKVIVTVEGVSSASIMPKLDGGLGAMLYEMNEKGLADSDSPNKGLRFLSRAIDGRLDAEQASTTIEGAARLSAAGATQGVTLSAVNAGAGASMARMAMASPLQAQKPQVVALQGDNAGENGLSAGDTRNGVGLWIMPLYQSNNVWGMKAGEFKTGYTSDLGGVAIGADYTIDEALRFGLSFNLGGGYAQSQGDFNKTDNSYNFWGVNLYGGWTQNNFGLIADVGYTSNYNKVQQELPSNMAMGDIKSDITSSAIAAGLRAEYKWSTDVLDIIPHLGVRYTGLKTDSYDAKSGGTVFSTEENFQNIWTFPVGVTLTKEIESSSGWSFKPQLDLQIIPAAGDVKAKNKIKVPGLDSRVDLSTRVMDDFSYGAGLGFDLKKGDVSFGLNYTIQASEHSTAHGVFGTMRYEF